MIHAEDGVELRPRSAVKYGVRRMRSGEFALAGEFRHGGCDDLFLLVAELSAFPGMRVEPGHRDARCPPGAQPHERGEQAADADDLVRAEKLRNIAEWNVDGDKRDGQGSAGEAHREVVCSCAGREELGLPGEGEAGFMQRFLGHGAGDHARDPAGAQQRRRFLERVPCGAGRLAGGLSGGVARGIADHAVIAGVRERRVGQAGADEFRSDAGGIADGESEDGASGHAQKILTKAFLRRVSSHCS